MVAFLSFFPKSDLLGFRTDLQHKFQIAFRTLSCFRINVICINYFQASYTALIQGHLQWEVKGLQAGLQVSLFPGVNELVSLCQM